MSVAFAHAGHWLVNAAYVAPLLFLVGVIVWGKLKDRHSRQAGPEA